MVRPAGRRWLWLTLLSLFAGATVALAPLWIAALVGILAASTAVAVSRGAAVRHLDQYSWLLGAALAIHVVVTSQHEAGLLLSVARFGLVLLLLLAAAEWRRVALSGQSRPAIHAIVALVVVAGASVVASVDPFRSMSQLMLFAVAASTVVLSIRRWQFRARLQVDLALLFGIYALVALVGVVAWVVGLDWSVAPPNDRVGGLFANPNSAGMMGALILPLGFGLVRRAPRRAQRILIHGAMGFLAVSVLLSGSRTAMLALIVGTLVALAPRWRSYRRAGVMMVAVVVLVLTSGVLSGVIENLTRGENMRSLSGREGVWLTLVDSWAESPVLGTGYRSAEVVLEQRHGLPYEYPVRTAHSGYLQTLAELGVLGLATLLTLVTAIARAGWRNRRDPLRSAALGSVAAGFAIQIGESSLFGFGGPFALPFWLLIGTVCAVPLLRQPTEAAYPRHLTVRERHVRR